MQISPDAEELNKILQERAPQVYALLSEAGRKAFFPKAGILAQSAEAKGKSLNATIGVALNDCGNPLAVDAITRNSKLSAQETVSYSPSYGQQALREKWLERIRQNNPSLKSRTSLPVVTNAITHGLSIIAKLFINNNEKIIVPNLIWPNYRLVFQHAELDMFPCFAEGKFNVSGLKRRLEQSPGKQVILLNFPNNPTGYSATTEDAEQIIHAIEQSARAGNNILVICDDAYFGLFFEDNVFRESLFARLVDLHENVFAMKCDGITKEMYAWGLRVGFVTYAFRGMDEEVAGCWRTRPRAQ